MAHPSSDDPEVRSPSRLARHQEAEHAHGHDYEPGSPHLRHSVIRTQIVTALQRLVREQIELRGTCRALEIGAGHGGFTDVVLAAGAQVDVTEMSRPSVDALRARFDGDDRVRVIYDPDGVGPAQTGEMFDLTLCISVLHHIPDYLAFVRVLADHTLPGGSFASFQDPLWYPRRTRVNRVLDRYAYFAWRLSQGSLRRGLATRLRRMRGVLDEDNPADMSEYHVVREGVDEEALCSILESSFADVQLWRYWSTQAPLLQSAGDRLGLETTFGLIARNRS